MLTSPSSKREQGWLENAKRFTQMDPELGPEDDQLLNYISRMLDATQVAHRTFFRVSPSCSAATSLVTCCFVALMTICNFRTYQNPAFVSVDAVARDQGIYPGREVGPLDAVFASPAQAFCRAGSSCSSLLCLTFRPAEFPQRSSRSQLPRAFVAARLNACAKD